MAEKRGGAREGAGRKKNTEKFAHQWAGFTELCADHLEEAFDHLWTLCEGATKVETKEVKACTMTRKDVVRDEDGRPITDGKGKLYLIDVLIFPAAGPDEMVLVERKTLELPPDVRAIAELIQRVGGRPFNAEDEAPDAGDAIGPADLENLASEDLDALEQIALRLSERRPRGGAGGDPGGPT